MDQLKTERTSNGGYRCVLFDLDNTLIDTEPLVRQAFIECGWTDSAEISDDDLRAISPVKLLQAAIGSQLEGKFWSHYLNLATANSRLIDYDTPRVLQALSEAGISLGIVTTNVLNVATVALRACDILRYFERCIVTYETCLRRKPHPEPLIHALELLGQEREEAIFVGDSERDALASRDSGVHFGLAGWVPRVDRNLANVTATTVLESVWDLLDVAGLRCTNSKEEPCIRVQPTPITYNAQETKLPTHE